MSKFRAAIIGCGRMGSLFEEDPLTREASSHAGALKLFSQTEIIAACDIREDRLKRFSETWNVNSLYTDYKELLDKEEIDILTIATPTESHKEICVEASRTGIKAIFCEKPMACSIADCEEMIRACQQHGVLLVINHTRRWDSGFQLVGKLIEDGEIGNPTTINGYSTVGFMNGGTHLIDLLRLYLGNVIEVQGWIHEDLSTDPGGRAIIKFDNGALCYLDAIWRDYVFFGIDVFGERGLIKTSGMIRSSRGFELLKAHPSKNETGIYELHPEEIALPEWNSPLIEAFKDIVTSLQNNSKPKCTGEDGRAAVEIAIAIHESHRLGNIPLKLPIKNKEFSIIPRATSFTKDGLLKN